MPQQNHPMTRPSLPSVAPKFDELSSLPEDIKAQIVAIHDYSTLLSPEHRREYERVNLPSPDMHRARVVFRNGYQLSIIFGCYSYGYEKGLFELGLMDAAGQLDESLEDDDDIEALNGIVGFASVERVFHYMRKLAFLPAPAAVEGQLKPLSKLTPTVGEGD